MARYYIGLFETVVCDRKMLPAFKGREIEPGKRFTTEKRCVTGYVFQLPQQRAWLDATRTMLERMRQDLETVRGKIEHASVYQGAFRYTEQVLEGKAFDHIAIIGDKLFKLNEYDRMPMPKKYQRRALVLGE